MPAGFTVVSFGRVAQAVLRAGHSGEVIAVFRRSFYVRFDSDIICVGGLRLRQGPLNVLCRLRDDLAWDDVLAPQMPVSSADDAFLTCGQMRFDCAGATTWRAPVANQLSIGAVRAGLDNLAAAATARAPGGLGRFLMTPHYLPFRPGADDSEGLLRQANEPITALRAWLQAALAGAAAAPPRLDALIGLGPGLTPSGDDFLCGAMAALHYVGRRDVAARLAAAVLPTAQTATSLISASYLRCAAQGEASEVLFEALECLLEGGQFGLQTRLDAIEVVGHTSGWDSLAGAAAACDALCAAAGDIATD